MTTLKRYWLIIVLILIIILLIVVKYKPSPPTIPNQKIFPTPTLTTLNTQIGKPPNNPLINFTGNLPTLPATLPIFQSQPVNIEQYATSLAQQLNLTQSPLSQFLWQKGSVSLTLMKSSSLVEIDYYQPTPTPPGIDLNQAINAAQTYLKQLGQTQFQLDTNNVLLVDNRSDLIYTTPKDNLPASQASLAVIPFFYTLNQLPLQFNDVAQGTLQVIVDSTYNIRKATFNPPSTSPNIINEVSLLTFNTILTQLQAGNYSYISIEGSLDPKTTPISQLTLNQAWLEYRQDTSTNQILPYVLFRGQGTINSTAKVNVEIITPAFAS